MKKEVHILVVEDSLTQAEKLKFILEKNAYRISIAKDGLEALDIIKTDIPDLVITDILMPKMDGYKLCEILKNHEKYKSIPVILLTSLSDQKDVITGLKAKADNFITKPYNEDFLLSRIQHMLINLELRRNKISEIGIEVYFAGEKHFINSERIQIIDLLLSTFENAVQKTKELEETNKNLKSAFGTIRKLENNYRNILDSSVDALIVINPDKKILYKNPAAKKLFSDKIDDYTIDFFGIEEINIGTKEITINREDAEEVIADINISETNWEGQEAYLLSIRDITEKVRLLEKLRIQATTDDLTSLYNRRGFLNSFKKKLEYAQRNNKSLVLFFLDIDGMKWINDTLSHNDGDLALIETAKILKTTFSYNDVISRIGGDEFAIISLESDSEVVQRKIKKLIINQEALNNTKKYEFKVSISIGTAYFNSENPANIDELMSRADQLMYYNKNGKKNSDYRNN
jgi:two-component system cell cycle response regulator